MLSYGVDADLTQPRAVICTCVLYVAFWENRLNFVLTVYKWFHVLRFPKEGPELIALHPLELIFTFNVYKLL